MTPKKILAQIRKLLRSRERDDVRQALALAETLAAEGGELGATLRETMAAGIWMNDEGQIVWGAAGEVGKRVRREHQPWCVLRVARWVGLLDEVASLDLSPLSEDARADLSILEGLDALRELDLGSTMRSASLALPALPGLTSLKLASCYALTDVSALAGLTGLRELTIEGASALRDLSPLAELAGLESLMIGYAKALTDLSPLAGLTALRTLDIRGCEALTDLSPLAGLTGLTALSLIRADALSDLSPLSGLTALESLHLTNCAQLRDLSPLAGMERLELLQLRGLHALRDLSPLSGLSALRELDLWEARNLQDISPLVGLSGLASLSLANCRVLRDISPLAEMPGLRSLDLRWIGATDLSALRGATALAEGLELDEEGRACRGGSPLSDHSLLLALQVDSEAMLGVRSLTLRGCYQLLDLSRFARLTQLEHLDLQNCRLLHDVSGLIPLERLAFLDLTSHYSLKTKPRRATLATLEDVTDYRRAIGRALSRATDRTPEQDALLETAERLGLLERAARSGRGATKKTVSRIRRLLTSREFDERRQGAALLMSLGAPAVLADLADGITIDADGALQRSEAALRRPHLRGYGGDMTAVALMRAAGQLDGLARLDLSDAYFLDDLAPLAGLEALRSLSLFRGPLHDLAGLEEIPNLESLQLKVRSWSDLAPLAGCAILEELTLYECPEIADLSPLASIGLRRLQIERCRQLAAGTWEGEALAELLAALRSGDG